MTKIPEGTERLNLIHSLRGVSPQLLGSMHLGSVQRRKLVTLCWTRRIERGREETDRQKETVTEIEEARADSKLFQWFNSDPGPPRLLVTLAFLTSLWPHHPLHDQLCTTVAFAALAVLLLLTVSWLQTPLPLRLPTYCPWSNNCLWEFCPNQAF